MKRIAILALALFGVAGANARKIPENITDTVKFNKIQAVLDAVDELDDVNLYGDVTGILMNTFKEGPQGEYLTLEYIRFGNPERVDSVLATMPETFRNREDVRRYVDMAHARINTAPGKKYVDFEGENAEGGKINLSSLVKPGEYTLIDFWASWCPYCIREIPALKEILNEYGPKGFNIVGVAVRDEPAKTKAMVEKKSIPWPVLYNMDRIPYNIYGFVGIPHHILVSPDGTIISRGESAEQIAARLGKLLN